MLDGRNGVGLAFIRSARVVLGPGRALSFHKVCDLKTYLPANDRRRV